MKLRSRHALLLAPLALLAACSSGNHTTVPSPTTAVVTTSGVGDSTTTPVTTTTPATTVAGATGQALGDGFGYVRVRDGVTLSVNVMLPGPATSGPYPTVVEYSGYDPSNPDNTTYGQLYNALGFAYVGVNMRGTGCSGGSFVFFEDKQLNDGYDAVETVAAQPWVLNHKVGMVGVSYAGIAQLFVASTRPPSLEAIAPLSTFDDAYRATLYPGGILNTGFAVTWAKERTKEAEPFGQPWTKKRSDAGDSTCTANQTQRGGNQDLAAQIRNNPYYDPAVADQLNPSLLVGKIDVPVFLAGAWQDEQTGGHFPAFLGKFTSAPHLYVSLTNGLHSEAVSLGVLERYYEFLDLYVAHRTPTLDGLAKFIPGLLYNTVFGVPGMQFPPTRFDGLSYEDALSKYESEPPVRVLFEEGAADGLPPGAPAPRFERDFAAWPIPSTTPTPFVLTAAGGGGSYAYNPDATADTFYSGSLADIWRADVKWDWKPAPKGAVVAFEGPTLQTDQTLIGSASADLWITSTTPDTDIEVTITEVRPDGEEVYVQSGWLRASQRALDVAASSVLRPAHTQTRADSKQLTPGEPTLVRVEVFPFAHVFRKGSRLRVIIGSPGGNRAQWTFEDLPAGGTVNVLTDQAHPSQLMLPVVPDVQAPAGLPACGALRGQPCRPYQPLG